MPPCHHPKALNAKLRLGQGTDYRDHVIAEPPSAVLFSCSEDQTHCVVIHPEVLEDHSDLFA